MIFSKNVFCVVDGYSTGKHVVYALKAYGFDCIHVQSSEYLPEIDIANFKPDDYLKCIVWQGEPDFLSQIEGYNIKAVFPGCESGVIVADDIINLLGLATANDPMLSQARRNKYHMVEALKAHRVNTVEHIKADSFEKIQSWIHDNNIEYPLVCKPLESAGTFGVSICKTEAELKSSVCGLLNAVDISSGLVMNEVLVETFSVGQEYSVNTVSYDGKHHVSEIMCANKTIIERVPIYDYSEMLSPVKDKVIFNKLSQYVSTVLDALGIRYGAAHTEVIYNSEKDSVIMIECGARLNGGIDLSAYTSALGYSQLSLLMGSYLNPEAFLQYQKLCTQELQNHMMVVFLISDGDYTIRNEAGWNQLFDDMKTLHAITVNSNTFCKTKDIFNAPGFLTLIGKDRAALKRDYEYFRSIESKLYQSLSEEKAIA